MRALLLSPNPDPSSDPQVLWACCEVQLQTALWVFGHGRHNGGRARPQTQRPTPRTPARPTIDHHAQTTHHTRADAGRQMASVVRCLDATNPGDVPDLPVLLDYADPGAGRGVVAMQLRDEAVPSMSTISVRCRTLRSADRAAEPGGGFHGGSLGSTWASPRDAVSGPAVGSRRTPDACAAGAHRDGEIRSSITFVWSRRSGGPCVRARSATAVSKSQGRPFWAS
jgi:hypothetical protein